jgi:hypothetical protein
VTKDETLKRRLRKFHFELTGPPIICATFSVSNGGKLKRWNVTEDVPPRTYGGTAHSATFRTGWRSNIADADGGKCTHRFWIEAKKKGELHQGCHFIRF